MKHMILLVLIGVIVLMPFGVSHAQQPARIAWSFPPGHYALGWQVYFAAMDTGMIESAGIEFVRNVPRYDYMLVLYLYYDENTWSYQQVFDAVACRLSTMYPVQWQSHSSFCAGR